MNMGTSLQHNIGEDDHFTVDVFTRDVRDCEGRSSRQHVGLHGIDGSWEGHHTGVGVLEGDECLGALHPKPRWVDRLNNRPFDELGGAVGDVDGIGRCIVGPMEVGVEDWEGIAGLEDGVVLEGVAGALSKGGGEQKEEKTEEEDGFKGFSHDVQRLYYSLLDLSLIELRLDLLFPTNAFLHFEDGISF
ncbi:hypothetical protein ACLOJK_038978 [Asimina triloba]